MEAGGGPPSPPGRFLKAPQQRRAGPPPLPAPPAGARGGRAGGLLRRLAELERRVETRRIRRWQQEEEEEEVGGLAGKGEETRNPRLGTSLRAPTPSGAPGRASPQPAGGPDRSPPSLSLPHSFVKGAAAGPWVVGRALRPSHRLQAGSQDFACLGYIRPCQELQWGAGARGGGPTFPAGCRKEAPKGTLESHKDKLLCTRELQPGISAASLQGAQLDADFLLRLPPGAPPESTERKGWVPATAPPPSLQRLLLQSGGASPSLPSIDSDGPARPGHGRSLSQGSSLSSLDELFCGAAHSHVSSSSDFQVNVLSLADLAPRLASQKEGLTEEEATAMETSGCLSFADPQSVFKSLSATAGGKAAAAMEEDPGEETEISEQLGGSSVECSSGEQNPSSAQYSEDFGSLAEDTPRLSSSSENSHREGLDASLEAGLSAPSSPCLPPMGRRIPMKDVAVQTGSSSLPPQGLKTAAAALDWMVGGPNAHQTVSMEALEARISLRPALGLLFAELTSYRPAVSALNDTLKQNLLLIQQFVKASRHLHLSFVALLEEEEFHYHTLEEAKRYIDHHKCPPLTLEQALHELEEEKQAAG
ncbi:uncharacterized protein C19orf44 homolog [Heteronotia binoei]|uniref:uncharacterized protein C19orf44 homolog n=1 Tax=Heteronotia binoei TaxID=13085 RepID=UPI002930B638|nr:uncharacterized protein C19orf44 homolog [Heteronotia binoei]